jgi:hypothetical protein
MLYVLILLIKRKYVRRPYYPFSAGWKWINLYLNKLQEQNFHFVLNFIHLIRDNWKKNSLGRVNITLVFDLHSLNFRYLFALQIKRDLAMGALLCSDNTAALLASYIVQGI